MMDKTKNIALLGQPNSGKSTIFNTLTGMHQHVGNWPGKTVEKKEGTFTHNEVTYKVADLPGSYSLSANSDEEIVTREYIAKNDLDLVCLLADASQLERSMYMLADYAGIKTPVMLVLTMMDVAKSKGKEIDVKKLSEKLGIEVCSIVAYDKNSYETFFNSLEKAITTGKTLNAEALYAIVRKGEGAKDFESYMDKASLIAGERRSKEWIAMKLLEEDEAVLRELAIKGETNIPINSQGALYTSDARFKWIEDLLAYVVTDAKKPSELLTKFDRVAIGPRSGKWVAFGIMILALAGAMIVAAPIMGLGGALPSILNPLADSLLGGMGVSESIIHFVKATIIVSLGWVIAMVGFIFAMNFVFGILEEVGYMARVSYVFDRSMSKIGLQGKALMPMIMGFGCTMGSTSGARVIDSYGQKIMTIAVAWAVPCGATFVVIPTLANAFFGNKAGFVMIGLYLFGILVAIAMALIMKNTVFTGNAVPFVMELPNYRMPSAKNVLRLLWDKSKDFITRAFSIILVSTIVVWFLQHFDIHFNMVKDDSLSILALIAGYLVPLFKPLGLGDWRIVTSLVSGFMAKESVVATLKMSFGSSIREVFNATSAMTILVFSLLYTPCVAAIAAIKRELGKGWGVGVALWQCLVAYLFAFLTRLVCLWIGL